MLGAEMEYPDPLTFFTASPELAGVLAVAKRPGARLTMCTHVLDDDAVGVSVGMSREVKLAALRATGTVYRVPASACEPLEGKIGEFVAYDDVPVVGPGLTVTGADLADLLVGISGPWAERSHRQWTPHAPCARGGTLQVPVRDPRIPDWPVPFAQYSGGRWRFWIDDPQRPGRRGVRRRSRRSPGQPS